MVRPEVFFGVYYHGDTVDLPVSTVDGYQYSRDELCYAWSFYSTGEGKTGWNSYNGMVWFFQTFVDPNTGAVSCEMWYTGTVDGKKNQQTNDGILFVWIFASRRKQELTLAAQPYYQDHPDSDLAQDDALATTLAKDINNDAKFAVVGSEALYMGTYKTGQQIAQPISPVDGYVYSYDEVIWKWSLVWTTDGDTYEAPELPTYACLNRIKTDVDGTGNVTLYVDYHNVPDHPIHVLANAGRIAVVALCNRRPHPPFIPPRPAEANTGGVIDPTTGNLWWIDNNFETQGWRAPERLQTVEFGIIAPDLSYSQTESDCDRRTLPSVAEGDRPPERVEGRREV